MLAQSGTPQSRRTRRLSVQVFGAVNDRWNLGFALSAFLVAPALAMASAVGSARSKPRGTLAQRMSHAG